MALCTMTMTRTEGNCGVLMDAATRKGSSTILRLPSLGRRGWLLPVVAALDALEGAGDAKALLCQALQSDGVDDVRCLALQDEGNIALSASRDAT